MFKKLKEGMMAITHLIGNNNKDIEIKKKKHGNSESEKNNNWNKKNALRDSTIDLSWQKKKWNWRYIERNYKTHKTERK